MNGIIVLDKPARISSAAAVNRVKRLLDRGTKIGHAGTLDPFATGVLLLLIGKATKASSMFMDRPKTYEGSVKFGATTHTDDPESPEILRLDATEPTRAEIEAVAAKMIGPISQQPPVFSALKLSGQPAYELARRGEPVELKPRTVRIDSIQILAWIWPILRIRVECGRGTYIRSIARDLGEALHTGGYLTELRRTRIGEFDLATAVTLERLTQDGIQPHLRPITALPPQEPSDPGK